MTKPKAWRSKFFQRYRFARLHRALVLGDMDDKDFAALVGKSPAWVSLLKLAAESPRAEGTVAVAMACGVDPGWLAHGEMSQAPAPPGWAAELERLRAEDGAQKKRRRGRD